MTYDSPLRRRQAAETRGNVVDAARRLFAAKGFPATTIADVAHEAGVSPQTVYGTFGGKPGLVVALVDLIDQDSDVPALAGRLMTATTHARCSSWPSGSPAPWSRAPVT